MGKLKGHRRGNSPEPPDEYLCPITQDIMQDPVVAADGRSYERNAIAEWFDAHNTSPMTNLELPHRNLIPNIELKSLIQRYVTSRQERHRVSVAAMQQQNGLFAHQRGDGQSEDNAPEQAEMTKCAVL